MYGGGSRAPASFAGASTKGVRITIWKQQQRQASPLSPFWLDGAPEISQVAGERTSHAISSIPVSRRIAVAAIRKIMTRENMSEVPVSHKCDFSAANEEGMASARRRDGE